MSVKALIPTRFMVLMGHLVLAIVLFFSIDENIKACLPDTGGNIESQVASIRQSYYGGLGSMIALIVVELCFFIAGVTMFMPFQDILSISAHFSASISLSYFIFESWPCDWFWWIFGFCSVFPAFTEILAALGFFLNWNF